MRKRKLVPTVLVAIFLAETSGSIARAQDRAATPETSSAPTSAASSGSVGAVGDANQSGGAAPAQPAKHVWSNEDVDGLRNNSSISTIGSNKTQKVSAPATGVKPRPKPASFYRNQIARLRAQLPPINQQIAELEAALSGKTTDQPRKYWGVTLDDWKSELTRLQKKRADIQGQISAVEDQARHDGVAANALE